jgi:hypothetical protein
MSRLTLVLLCGTFAFPAHGDDPPKKVDKPVDPSVFVPTPEPVKLPDDLRKPGPFDDDYPIPQDAAKAEKIRAGWLAWWKAQVLTEYDKSAKKEEPWHAKGRAALEAVAVYKSAANQKSSLVLDPAVEGTRQALLAECPDVMVRYVAFPWHGVDGDPDRSRVEDILAFIDPLLKGPYPASIKARAAWETAVRLESNRRYSDRQRALAPKYYESFWDHYVELAKSKDRHDQDLTVEFARQVEDQYVTLGQKRQDGHAAVVKAFDLAVVVPWVRQTAEGNYKYFTALEAKANPSADAGKLFKERLASARNAYTTAWEANKEMPEAATMMIRVCIEENAPREEMEVWFARAMQADPDNMIACQSKLIALRPGNMGSDKAMLAFGRQCLRTMNHHAALGYVLDDAHRILSTGKGAVYYSQEVPWADLREVYETRLKAYPTDRYARTRYGVICYTAGEGPGAFHHLSAVKGNPWPGLTRSFETTLKNAEALAKEQAGNP